MLDRPSRRHARTPRNLHYHDLLEKAIRRAHRGLGAAALARQMHTALMHAALVLDSGVYRNVRAAHVHNVLGHDHVDPTELRRKARAGLERRHPSVVFEKAMIVSAREDNEGGVGGFVLNAEDGTTEHWGRNFEYYDGDYGCQH